MELAVPDLLELRRQHLPENWTATQKEREMQVPAWLLDLIADCLEKSPEKRYKNGMQLQEAIIENSIADIKTGKGNNSKVNQAAIGEVAPPVSAVSYTPPPDTGMINLSKPVFYGFMVLLFVFMGLAGYSLFSKSAVPANPVTKTVVDTPKTIDSEQVANEYYTRKHREKQKLVDSTTLNAIRDAQMRRESNPDSAATDTSNKQNN